MKNNIIMTQPMNHAELTLRTFRVDLDLSGHHDLGKYCYGSCKKTQVKTVIYFTSKPNYAN